MRQQDHLTHLLEIRVSAQNIWVQKVYHAPEFFQVILYFQNFVIVHWLQADTNGNSLTCILTTRQEELAYGGKRYPHSLGQGYVITYGVPVKMIRLLVGIALITCRVFIFWFFKRCPYRQHISTSAHSYSRGSCKLSYLHHYKEQCSVSYI
jgi:hypothetical protein